MVKIVRCPGIAKERGMMEVYGDAWPQHGDGEPRSWRKVVTPKRKPEPVDDIGEDVEFEDVI